MGKFFEKILIIVLLAIIGYFLFSISSSLKESARYDSDLRACAKMKAFMNDKESSKLFEQQAASATGVKVKFVGEYCKKLTLQNFFWKEKKIMFILRILENYFLKSIFFLNIPKINIFLENSK